MIIATAGHVDHGKSSLIRAITGQETDRLPEEKARGLSIDIGFAHLTHEQTQIAFVDVPGHEKFLRNMLAGVAGVDAVLLVVAADEGVMPQTREHVEILDMLGISTGIVAITRADLVDDTELAKVTNDVTEWLSGTGLRAASVMPVSVVSQLGVTDLVAALLALPVKQHTRALAQRFRFLVDRTFSLSGIGLVATGTVTAGTVTQGTTVYQLPGSGELRVRSLQRHDDTVQSINAGQRAAINLVPSSGSRTVLSRGDWLVGVDETLVTQRFDAHLKLNPATDRRLKHWHGVQLCLGASQYPARVAFSGESELGNGPDDASEGYVQLVLERPVHVVFGDRFVIRDGAAGMTVGGGRVIDPYPPMQKRARRNRQAILKGIDTTDDLQALKVLLEHSPIGCDLDEFCMARQLPDGATLEGAARVSMQVGRQRRYISEARFDTLTEIVRTSLTEWHAQYPEQVGPDVHYLRARAQSTIDPSLWLSLVDQLVRDRVVVRSPAGIALPTHTPTLSQSDESLWQSLKERISASDLQPPAIKDLAQMLSMERDELLPGLNRIASSGRLIRVAANRFFHPDALMSLAAIAVQLDESRSSSAGFTAREYRDASSIGRNLTIDVLEYFDRVRFTRRLADKRRVIATAEAVFGR